MQDDRPMMKASDIAAALNVSRSKAYELLASGEIPSMTVGGCRRVRPSTFEAYLDAKEQEKPTRFKTRLREALGTK